MPTKVRLTRDLGEAGKKLNPTWMEVVSHRVRDGNLTITYRVLTVSSARRMGPTSTVELIWDEYRVLYVLVEGEWRYMCQLP